VGTGCGGSRTEDPSQWDFGTSLLKSRGVSLAALVTVPGVVGSIPRLTSVQRCRKKGNCAYGRRGLVCLCPRAGRPAGRTDAPFVRCQVPRDLSPCRVVRAGLASPASPPSPPPPTSMGSAYSKFGVDVPFDPQYSLVTSPVYTPSLLASIRLLFGFYYLVSFIFKFSWDSVHSPEDLEQSVHVRAPSIYP